MDVTEVKHVVEAALMAAGKPVSLDELGQIFKRKGTKLEKAELKTALESLSGDYDGRGLEVKEVASGFRVQVRSTMSDWLQPLWEQRAPRYTRALLETLALIAYRQPITRGEIEEVRGVVVSTNIIRTLLERNWVRVVGHRDVPGKPEMFGTTREFLDYFGLKSLDDLPALAEIQDGMPEESPQGDLIESLKLAAAAEQVVVAEAGDDGAAQAQIEASSEELTSDALNDAAQNDADIAEELTASDEVDTDGIDLDAHNGDAEPNEESSEIKDAASES